MQNFTLKDFRDVVKSKKKHELQINVLQNDYPNKGKSSYQGSEPTVPQTPVGESLHFWICSGQGSRQYSKITQQKYNECYSQLVNKIF